MTSKQIEKAKKKIADIKRALAAEKRKFGCYDDSRGLRYLSTKYFIQLDDYAGGGTYLKWFAKNFPDDVGFPEFLFEQTIIFFKLGKTKDAERTAYQTFFSNPYWFEKFFGRPIIPLDIWHSSNITTPEYTEALEYSYTQTELAEFTAWLGNLVSTDRFITLTTKYIDLYRRLNTETDHEMRQSLVQTAFQLQQDLE